MKPKKKRNPFARELMCSGKYGQRVVQSKKLYTRKEKHKKSFGKKDPELFYCGKRRGGKHTFLRGFPLRKIAENRI